MFANFPGTHQKWLDESEGVSKVFFQVSKVPGCKADRWEGPGSTKLQKLDRWAPDFFFYSNHGSSLARTLKIKDCVSEHSPLFYRCNNKEHVWGVQQKESLT